MNRDQFFRLECLQRLLVTYTTRDSDGDAALAAYVTAIEPYEDCDVAAAIDAIITGRVDGLDGRFRPPAPFLASVVRRRMNDRLDSERRSRLALRPPPPIEISPEERERVTRGFRELLQMLAAKGDRDEGARLPNGILARTNDAFHPAMDDASVAERLLGRRPVETRKAG